MSLSHQQRCALDAQLLRHEGLRLRPYSDTLGHRTIGIGHLLSKGISRRAAEVIYEDDLQEAITYLHTAFPWTQALATADPIRYRVLVDMAFNLGSKLSDFRSTMKAAKAGDWEAMASHMAESLWAKQVGQRADTLIAMIRTGQDPFAP